ncbi:MAG: hypothetical protein ACI9AU_000112 [Bacteroidia bacterium]|jgi:hypothetical protein
MFIKLSQLTGITKSTDSNVLLVYNRYQRLAVLVNQYRGNRIIKC